MRVQQLFAGGLLMVITLLSSVTLPTQKSTALCATPRSELLGNWININSNTRSITQVKINFACGDVALCDTNGHCSQDYTGFVIRVYGACHPTNCAWGQATAKVRKLPHEVLTASYNQGFAQRNLFANLNNGQLLLTSNTHFTDRSGRSDYKAFDYFKKSH
ncbi:MAG: hypothetical protein PUP93_07200 [Rhizonema sp. NSF051]|nr:hypothetical protein [Rhizonema sp. NSF051]